MAFDLTGRRTASVAAILLVAMGLSACTTTEGTNAFTDIGTFEREVMTSTAQGIGLVPKEEKPDPTNPRGALAEGGAQLCQVAAVLARVCASLARRRSVAWSLVVGLALGAAVAAKRHFVAVAPVGALVAVVGAWSQ